ncbi:MAG: O-antigen ligase family protein [Planctomycetota bacterium]|nr:O-antigen ligase family protein [Planctomycetota bacterium]
MFVSIAVVMAIAWVTRQCILQRPIWRSTAGQWVFLSACALVVLQVFPLSPNWVSALTPSTTDILNIWTPGGSSESQLGNWPYLSFNPQATKCGLAMLFAYGIFFLITVQRVETINDVEKLLRWMALSAMALAFVGLIQFAFKEQTLLWSYGDVVQKPVGMHGCFTNPNHFSHLLALGISACLSWILIKVKCPFENGRRLRMKHFGSSRNSLTLILICIGTGIVAFACLVSMSRGGILSMLVVFVVLACICRKLLGRQLLYYLFGFICLGGILLSINGFDDLAKEIDSVKGFSFQEADYKQMRTAIWGANVKAIENRPWFGHGVGTHRDFYKMYLEKPFPVQFTHAESGYLQIGSESGVVGLTFLFSGIFICGFWCVRGLWRNDNYKELICIAAVSAALMASVVHSVFDFVWFIPACMSWTMIFCGLGCRLYQMRGNAKIQSCFSLSRTAWMGMAVILVIVSLSSLNVLVGPATASSHWDNYRTYALKRQRVGLEMNHFNISEGKKNELIRVATGLDKILEEEIRAYLSKDLQNSTAHLRMAAIYLRQFQSQQRVSINPMEIGQIRDAAIASQFPSREALSEWLGRAIGEHQRLLYRALWHARQAVMRCPLQGESYLFLAELVFLEGKDQLAKRSLVEQAIRVRPFDGKVRLMAGKEAAVAGEVEAAIAHWKKSFQYSIDGKLDLLGLLSQRIPANIVIQMLEPSERDLPDFYQAYRMLGDRRQLEEVCKYFEPLLWKNGSGDHENSRLWIVLSEAYREVEKNEDALRCAVQANACDISNFDARMLLASLFYELGKYRDAETQLRWCVGRRPEHAPTQNLLKDVVKSRVASRGHTAKKR